MQPGGLGPRTESRKRAAARPARPLSAPRCAGSPAPLCDPRRCARGGRKRGRRGGERSGGRSSLPRSRPRPPAHWLGAAALWWARGEAQGRERSGAKGPRAARGPRAALHRSHLGRLYLPLADFFLLQGQAPTFRCTAIAHSRRFRSVVAPDASPADRCTAGRPPAPRRAV